MPLFQSLIDINCIVDGLGTHSHGKKYCDWFRASCNDLERYKLQLSACIKCINIPSSVLSSEVTANESIVQKELSDYYDNIITCIANATETCIPHSIKRHCQYSVPGWSYYVHDKHDEARQAFLVWVADGKPRCGIAYQTIYKTRAAFKQTLRFCRRHEEQMKAYSLAKSHDDKNAKTFWGNVAKVSCKQESPAVADKPARRESMPKIAPI